MRDRATLYLEQLEGRAGGFDAITADGRLSAKNLESSLLQYLEGPLDAPFDVVRTCRNPDPHPDPTLTLTLTAAGRQSSGVSRLPQLETR